MSPTILKLKNFKYFSKFHTFSHQKSNNSTHSSLVMHQEICKKTVYAPKKLNRRRL